MDIVSRILEGLRDGVDRHWRLRKDFFQIKPEYLLTVSVADALTEGFDGAHGLDLEIRLEEPTRSAAHEVIVDSPGMRAWMKRECRPSISRKGKIDLFVLHWKECRIIELKGFDPSATELKKDVLRICEYLQSNGGDNAAVEGFVAFPSLRDRPGWIGKHAREVIAELPIDCEVTPQSESTGEDPEHGIPFYYTNCLCLRRVADDTLQT